MNNEPTLAQLAAEVAQLRQQVEEANRRLDMIYGAINRLAAPKKSHASSTFAGLQALPEEFSPAYDRSSMNESSPLPESGEGMGVRAISEEPLPQEAKTGAQPTPTAGLPLSARMMMGPDTMLASLHQYALDAGLTLSLDAVDRLKSELPKGETHEAR